MTATAWRSRIVTAVVVLVGVLAYLAAAGHGVSLVTWVAIAPLATVSCWLVVDLGERAGGMDWTLSTVGDRRPAGGADDRHWMLSRYLEDLGKHRSDDYVHRLLVGIVDDVLQVRLGIDRNRDPDAAAAVLDPVLQDLVAAEGLPRRYRNPRHLSELLTRIEAL